MASSIRRGFSPQRRALLIFAKSSHEDCIRRHWPAAYRILFETQSALFDRVKDFDVHLFTSSGFQGWASAEIDVQVHIQEGASFGQRLDNAIESMAEIGYQELVIIGQDCPDLELVDVRKAFELLGTHRLVLGPDHRGGCYLIGIRPSDRTRLHGVCWQHNTDFRELCERFADCSTFELGIKIDLDTLEDLRLLAKSKSGFRWMAKALLDSSLDTFPRDDRAFQPGRKAERIHWQLPPPIASSLFNID